MIRKAPRILVYGYGNPGRQDDGAGVLLAEMIGQWARDNKRVPVEADTNYQLNLEDAAGIKDYDMVIFADASREEVDHFRLEPLRPSGQVEFSMHAVSPGFILHLTRQMFNSEPEAYLLHIRGYEWEFMENLTPGAGKNLDLAFQYIRDFLIQYMDNWKRS